MPGSEREGSPGPAETQARARVLAERRRWRRGLRWLALLVLAVAAVQAWRETTAPPVLRQTTVELAGMPAGAAPLRVVLIGDTHVVSPDMPPQKLARVVARINALHPDLVLIAGDFTSDRWLATRHYGMAEAVAPLAGLRARYGTVAVLGNHDHRNDRDLPYDITPVRAELEALGIVVLENSAVRRGPLTIGGLDSVRVGGVPMRTTIDAMRALGPPYAVLVHIPDFYRFLPPDVPLMLAGHTHCGQVALPVLGPLVYASRNKPRQTCGRADSADGHSLVVTAGLGQSLLPFRLLAPADIWLVTLVPPHRDSPPPR